MSENTTASIAQSYDQPLPSNCPPETSSSRNQVVFRVVKNDPPSYDDFKTHAQLGLAKNAEKCCRSSISVFTSYRQANHLKDMKPAIGNHIAFANLTHAHGVISLPNNGGHMDWWAFSNMVKPEEFKVVQGEP
jgi:hypothetical protein